MDQIRKIKKAERIKISWKGLKLFEHRDSTKEMLIDRHEIPQKYHKNAEKQADQIRTVLMLAREYFQASQVATLATKPVLLYYSIMNLAISEILLKQSGESSLDMAREQHRHHGLIFPAPPSIKMETTKRLEHFIAKPLIDDSQRRGTFELWHRTAYHSAISLQSTTYGQLTTDFVDFGWGRDYQRMPQVPKSGVSLLDCICRLPSMFNISRKILSCGPQGLQSTMLRTQEESGSGRKETIVLSDYSFENFERIFSTCIPDTQGYRYIEFEEQELYRRLIIRLKGDPNFSSFPDGIPTDHNSWWLLHRDTPLNEFGLYYVALFMAGNYARYYPDFWIQDIERSSPFAVLIEELLDNAAEQCPLLTLAEFEDCLYLPFD